MKFIFFVFLFWRLFDLLIIYFASYFIPYLGFFPYKEILNSFHLPQLITKLANFDGVHYLLIAKNGYSQFEQAFFPLYPLLIRWLSPIFFNNLLLTALMISNFSFLLGIYFFIQYLKLEKINQYYLVILFLILFPTSFFFGTVYTEGLFLLFCVLTLFFLKRKQFFLAAICSFFTSLTRLIGVFLIVPIFFNLIKNKKLKPVSYLVLLSPLIGLFIYAFYLWQTTGDPFFFVNSQPAFGANRSAQIIFLPQVYWRYLKIFLTANFNFQYFISLAEFSLFNFVLIVLILDLRKRYLEKNFSLFGLNIFSLINLIIPSLTGTFSSIPRYILLSLSFFIYLGEIKNRLKLIIIGLTFLLFHIIFLSFFIQGYFIA